jgi:4a-hydroxytetrahydrobiopterin dehydratase
MSDLSSRQCVPCTGGVPPLSGDALAGLMRMLGGEWRLAGEHHIEREYRFPDFRSALAFTNRIGEIAEQQGHHPDILLGWGRVKVAIWTHAIDGLTESDFVLAAKVDRLLAVPPVDASGPGI